MIVADGQSFLANPVAGGYIHEFHGSTAVAIAPHFCITARHVGHDPGAVLDDNNYESKPSREILGDTVIGHPVASTDLMFVELYETLPGYHTISSIVPLEDVAVKMGGMGLTCAEGGTPAAPKAERWGTNKLGGGFPAGGAWTVFDVVGQPNNTASEVLAVTNDSGGGVFDATTMALIGTIHTGGSGPSSTINGTIESGYAMYDFQQFFLWGKPLRLHPATVTEQTGDGAGPWSDLGDADSESTTHAGAATCAISAALSSIANRLRLVFPADTTIPAAGTVTAVELVLKTTADGGDFVKFEAASVGGSVFVNGAAGFYITNSTTLEYERLTLTVANYATFLTQLRATGLTLDLLYTDDNFEALVTVGLAHASLRITFTVPQALAPSATNATTTEGVQTTSGLVITRHASNGAEITHIEISAIDPLEGQLYLNDGTTAIGDEFGVSYIRYSDANAGLKFTPAVGFTGVVSITFKAALDFGGFRLSAAGGTATITVSAAPAASGQVGRTSGREGRLGRMNRGGSGY